MLKTELFEIIANGENSGVEFKRDDCRPEQLAKEVVAMANLQGGRILLGVEDDGTISGLTRDNTEEWVMDTVFGAKVHPLMIPFYEEVAVDNETRVAIISFPAGISKPYTVRDKGREEIFVRVGTTSRRATREQLVTLFAVGGLLHPEVLPVPGTDSSRIDKARFRDYLERVIRDPSDTTSFDTVEQRLLGLSLLVETPQGAMACSIAGLVLFGVQTRQLLRHAGLRILVFEGDDIDSPCLFDRNFDGPLVGLWRTDSAGNVGLGSSDYGLFERVEEALQPFISQEELPQGRELVRETSYHYPPEVIRELLVNTLAHRDWTRAVEAEIRVFSGRLEFWSPGGFHNSMSIEKMKAGQRFHRNPIIVETLRDYGYIEGRGMGIRTKVIPLMLKSNGREPEFESTEDYLKTTLRRPRTSTTS